MITARYNGNGNQALTQIRTTLKTAQKDINAQIATEEKKGFAGFGKNQDRISRLKTFSQASSLLQSSITSYERLRQAAYSDGKLSEKEKQGLQESLNVIKNDVARYQNIADETSSKDPTGAAKQTIRRLGNNYGNLQNVVNTTEDWLKNQRIQG